MHLLLLSSGMATALCCNLYFTLCSLYLLVGPGSAQMRRPKVRPQSASASLDGLSATRAANNPRRRTCAGGSGGVEVTPTGSGLTASLIQITGMGPYPPPSRNPAGAALAWTRPAASPPRVALATSQHASMYDMKAIEIFPDLPRRTVDSDLPPTRSHTCVHIQNHGSNLKRER